MTQLWDAERRVDPELARKLIREQMPEVAAERIELLGEGWDNIVYRVDAEWVFRFPRRQMGADTIAVECAVLPRLAGRLPLPIPVPRYFGQPTEVFPWPFAGYRYLPGRTACRAALTDAERHALAAPLGRFLAALHALPTGECVELGVPGDTIGRMDREKRLPQVRERLLRLTELGLIDSPAPWLPLLRDLPRGPRPVCLVHGDLYIRHLLVDDDHRLCGVIDWGDVHRGDPAADLMILFALLPAPARSAFREAYGPISEDTRRLARFRALHHSAILALYAHDIADEDLIRESMQSLRYLSQEE